MSDSITGLSNTSYADTYDAKASALTDKLTNKDYSQATDDELMSVCKDFESYFLEQVLKSMEKMAKIDSEDEDSNLFTSMAGIGGTEDTSLNTLGSYFGDEMMSSYAKLITESNNGQGLGIAQQLYEQMKRNYSVDSIPEAE
ncbi:MAG: hypothetical protein PUB04_00065 [Clostridia bacterium]|nr:hypothetical protein [Clostridia bacterium]